MKIRLQAVAGQFYPLEKKELEEQLNQFLGEIPTKFSGRLRAIIVPHAGYIYSGIMAGKGFALLKELEEKTDWEVILLGPSHIAGFIGASVSLAEKWQTPLGEINTSNRGKEFVGGLFSNKEQVHSQEHCLEVELPFLQKTLKNFSIIPIVCGEIAPEIVCEELKNKIGPNSLVVVSSDLSHYLPYKEAKKIDDNTIKAIMDLDIEKMEKMGDACGKTPVLALMHLAKKKKWKPTLLGYNNSGDTAGDKDRVVGYTSIAFFEE